VFLALGTQREMPMRRFVTCRPYGSSTKSFRIIIIIIIIIITTTITITIIVTIIIIIVVTIIYCNWVFTRWQ